MYRLLVTLINGLSKIEKRYFDSKYTKPTKLRFYGQLCCGHYRNTFRLGAR